MPLDNTQVPRHEEPGKLNDDVRRQSIFPVELAFPNWPPSARGAAGRMDATCAAPNMNAAGL